MKTKPSSWFTGALVLLLFNACETDDIEPTITLSLQTDEVNVFEDQGAATLTAALNAATDRDVTGELLLSGSAQPNGVDYSLTATQVLIPAGSTEFTTQLTAVQDSAQEGNEEITISLASVEGALVDSSAQSLQLTLEDDDVAPTAQFILNEVLYDPSNNGLDGDANGDGAYVQDDDSFLELYNPSTRPYDLSDHELWDDTVSGSIQYTFPTGTTLPANGALVIFGGGTPSGSFGGTTVLTAGSGLNFNNSGEVIGIRAPGGSYVLSFDTEPLSNNPNESYTRNPDITGPFEQHGENTAALFSPGTRIDGSAF